MVAYCMAVLVYLWHLPILIVGSFGPHEAMHTFGAVFFSCPSAPLLLIVHALILRFARVQ